jgi:hypothetical protein
MAKQEPTPLGVFNHLWGDKLHTVMSNRAGLHAFLMKSGGTIIVHGCLRRVVSKNLGAGAYEVRTKSIIREEGEVNDDE